MKNKKGSNENLLLNLKVKNQKSNSGITLVALVITIVILLILAGITINLILGPNSIFEMARKAKEDTEGALVNEMAEIGNLTNYLTESGWGNYTGGSTGGGTGENPNPGGGTPTEPEKPTVGPNGKPLVDAIEKNDTENQEVEDINGNPITIPAGFTVVENSPEGTDDSEKVTYSYNGDGTPAVQDGIVIEDDEGNQFVWIPVGTIKNKAGDKNGDTTTITLGRYTFSTIDGTPTLQQDSANYTQTVTISSYYQELVSSTTNTPAKNLGDFITKAKERRRILYSKI